MFTLKSQRTIKFYNDNPNIDFETVNSIFIDLLEKVMGNMSNTINESKTLDILNELTTKINSLEHRSQEDTLIIQNIDNNTKNSISTLKNNIDSSISNQKEYIISSFRDVVKNNENENTQFIHKLISDNHELLQSKISKNLENLPKELQKSTLSKNDLCQELQKTHTSLTDEILPLLAHENSNSMKNELIEIIDTKYKELNSSINSRIENIMSTQSVRVETIMSSHTTTNNDILERLKPMKNVEEYICGQNNSNIKGKSGETKLEHILASIIPDANIINSSGSSESGDFIIERKEKPTILIDTKDYNTVVPKKEVDKIIRDIEKKKCNGILISQNSGIALKYDYEINIHNDFIIIFLHNVEYNEDKISNALQIIDMLFPIIQKQANMEYESINSEQLNLINKEFQEIISQKKKIIDTIEQNNKDIIKEISKIDIPTLSSILTVKFSQSEKLNYICDICNNWNGKNSRALSAHKRGCKIINTTT